MESAGMLLSRSIVEARYFKGECATNHKDFLPQFRATRGPMRTAEENFATSLESGGK
jgi:hypothetical protein